LVDAFTRRASRARWCPQEGPILGRGCTRNPAERRHQRPAQVESIGD